MSYTEAFTGFMESLPDVWLLYATIAFSVVICLWEEYLAFRQRNVLRSVHKVPDDIKHALSQDTFEKARLYNLDKSLFSTCHSFFDITMNAVFLVYGMMPLLWSLSAHTLSSLDVDRSEIRQSVLFVFLSSVVSSIIGLPWAVYSTFVVEQRHGFNKQTVGFFVKDKLKMLVVSQLISAPTVAAVVYIVRSGGEWFFVYLWMFCFLVLLFLMTVYPEFIAPLFDKYTPLPEGELRTRIEQLAQRLSFPLKKLYVVEGSKRSAHSNAYFYGFFNNKRIVLFDTLLESWDTASGQPSEGDAGKSNEADSGAGHQKKGCSDAEVVAVLSHELGHWSMNHVLKNMIVIQLNLLLAFVMFSALYRYDKLYRAFGFFGQQPAIVGLTLVLQHVLAPYSTLFSLLTTSLSRRFEFQADAFGKRLGYGGQLKSALVKLTADNLSFPVYDRLYSAWHHSHPPLLQRLAALDKTD